jgi:O-antigen/teichoic acid export membrane protein
MKFQTSQRCPLKQPYAWRPPSEREDVSLAADVVSQSVMTDRIPGLVDRIVKGGAWVVVGRFGGIAATMFVNIILAHALSPDEYGQFFLITTAIGFASVVAMCGVNGTIMRLVSESIGLKDSARGRRALWIGLRVALIAGPCVAIVTSLIIASLCQGLPVAAAVVPIAVALVLMAWQQIAAEGLRSMQEHRWANIFSGGQGGGVVTIGLFTGLFALGSVCARPSLQMALWMYAAAPLMTLPVTIFVLYRVACTKLSYISDYIPHKTTALQVRDFLNLSGSLLLIQTLVFATTQADVWFAGAVLSTSDFARYGAARRLLTVVVMPLQLINLTAAPSIGELFAAGRIPMLQRMLRMSSTIAFSVAFVLTLLLAVGGQRLLGLLFGPWYQEGLGVLLILALGQMVVAWCGSSGYALVMTGRQAVELVITLRASFLLLLLAPLAATFYGELGIAVAVSISAAVKGLGEWWAVRRLLGVDSHPDFSVFMRPLLRWWQRIPRLVQG